jgi:hypothetical protein
VSNAQTYPNSIFPIKGDVDSEIGDNKVTVTGIQHQPVDPAQPQAQQLLVYGSDGKWHPEDPVVSGTDAVGTTPTKPPVQVGGVDDGNLVRELRTDSQGAVELSMTDRTLFENILLELRAIKAAIVSLDSTAVDSDYSPDNFTDQKAGI